MNLKNLSIRKKLILSNFLMIFIPILIIIAIMGSILIGFLALSGNISRAGLLTDTNGTISNYQLQLVFDSMSKEIANKSNITGSHDLLELYSGLEKNGAKIVIYDDSATYYLTKGATAQELHAEANQITKSNNTEALFYRGQSKLVYQTTLKKKDGNLITILVTSTSLNYNDKTQNFMDTVERYVKLGVFTVGSLAIIIIILTGVALAGALSKRMIAPLNKLRQAANEIRDGNLDCEIDYSAHDELGQVCEDFDNMRLKLKASVELQKKYDDSRKELIAGISHDLSTPITTIKGYVSGLIDGIANTPEKEKRYLRTIYDTACDMNSLVDSLFLFSKLDLEKVPFHFEVVNLSDYFDDYSFNIHDQLKELNMQLFFINHTCGKASVKIDQIQFGRVLSNLIDNSIKYKKEGHGKIEITLEDLQDDVRIQFSDNGKGIHSDEADKIFDSFYRADPARSSLIKGNGLGLAITKQIIEHMGGHISAKGSLNIGLTLTITLPKSVEEI